jgi:hypothetical protein
MPLKFRENTSAINAPTRMMVSLFVKNVYCGDATLDPNTTKMNCCMHCIMNYQEYGGFMNYNAGMGERGLKTWANFISRTAQKRGVDLFNHQTTERLFDHLLLMKALRSRNTFHPDNKLYGNVPSKIRQPILDVNGDDTLKTTGAKFRIDLAAGACISLTATVRHMSPEVIAKIQSFFVGSGMKSIRVFTEAHLKKTNQNICACPDYNRMGSWFDYVIANINGQKLPSKVWAMFYGSRDSKGWAIVHCSKIMPDNKPKGLVCQLYELLQDENLKDTLDVIQIEHKSCPRPYT